MDDAIVALIVKYRLTVVPDEDNEIWYAGIFSYDYFSVWEYYAKLDGKIEHLGTGSTIAEAVTAAVAQIEAAKSKQK